MDLTMLFLGDRIQHCHRLNNTWSCLWYTVWSHLKAHWQFHVHGSMHHKSILINVQRDATICSLYFILLQDHSTCFRSRPYPSSGVHKTVVTVTGTRHMIMQLPHSSMAKLGLSPNLATLE